MDMTGVWLPIQAKGPLHIPRLNGEVHEAEGRLKVRISGHERGHQSPRLCVLREAYRLNLGSGELRGMIIDVHNCDSNLTCAAET